MHSCNSEIRNRTGPPSESSSRLNQRAQHSPSSLANPDFHGSRQLLQDAMPLIFVSAHRWISMSKRTAFFLGWLAHKVIERGQPVKKRV